jgi:hypothetical protein
MRRVVGRTAAPEIIEHLPGHAVCTVPDQVKRR